MSAATAKKANSSQYVSKVQPVFVTGEWSPGPLIKSRYAKVHRLESLLRGPTLAWIPQVSHGSNDRYVLSPACAAGSIHVELLQRSEAQLLMNSHCPTFQSLRTPCDSGFGLGPPLNPAFPAN
jgi:hypothetical protein